MPSNENNDFKGVKPLIKKFTYSLNKASYKHQSFTVLLVNL